MIGLILTLTTLICGVGAWFGGVPIGVIFVLSLIGFLYCFITMVGFKLSEIGTVIIICDGILLAYATFYIFAGIDLFVKLGLK